MEHRVSRRDFLKVAGAASAATAATAFMGRLAFLQAIDEIGNPLDFYPNRGWEKAYRDLYRTDQSFIFLCAPNDTHNCLLRAYSKRNVVTRVEASYVYGDAVDLYGNRSTHRWEPRACNKGLSMIRKFYGDRRVKGPMIRKGFLDWVEAGFPRDATGVPPRQYFNRGQDDFIRVTWDQAFQIVASAQVNIATTYSGPSGEAKLRAQGYDTDMLPTIAGAGTRTLKYRGGMPFLGATRLMGFYRQANVMSLLDSHIRGVSGAEAKGGRVLDSYSWHTDLPPGHPMVTGQQTVDFDLFTAENASVITIWGMNWISTKMPDSHWLTESRIKGAKVVVIACEYQSTANKADEVLIIRPGTDAALALGMVHVIMRDGLYDQGHVKSSTDLPLLVRMDTLKLLRPSEVIPGYQDQPLSNFTKVLKEGEKAPVNYLQDSQYIPEGLRKEWGDYTVWDKAKGEIKALSRDHVGDKFKALGIDPALEGTFVVKTTDGKSVEVRPVFDLVKEYAQQLDPKTVSEITWAPPSAVESIARMLAANPGKSLLVHGMGPNHFFNNDLKDRDPAPRRNHPEHRVHGRDARLVRRQLPGRLLQRAAALHRRGPVQPGPGSGRAGDAEELLQHRVGPLLQLRRPPTARR